MIIWKQEVEVEVAGDSGFPRGKLGSNKQSEPSFEFWQRKEKIHTYIYKNRVTDTNTNTNTNTENNKREREREREMEAAMGLMRRIPPKQTETALSALLTLLPHHSSDLLSQVDQPLQVSSFISFFCCIFYGSLSLCFSLGFGVICHLNWFRLFGIYRLVFQIPDFFLKTEFWECTIFYLIFSKEKKKLHRYIRFN